jgi:hypothetical protein
MRGSVAKSATAIIFEGAIQTLSAQYPLFRIMREPDRCGRRLVLQPLGIRRDDR